MDLKLIHAFITKFFVYPGLIFFSKKSNKNWKYLNISCSIIPTGDLRYKQFRKPPPDVSRSGSDSRPVGGRNAKPDALVFREGVFVRDETSQ